MFLNLGKYTINEQAIAFIEWEEENDLTTIYFRVAEGESSSIDLARLCFLADSKESKALREYFKGARGLGESGRNPSRNIDLLKDLEVAEAIRSQAG